MSKEDREAFDARVLKWFEANPDGSQAELQSVIDRGEFGEPSAASRMLEALTRDLDAIDRTTDVLDLPLGSKLSKGHLTAQKVREGDES